jgi:ribosomal protein S27AE
MHKSFTDNFNQVVQKKCGKCGYTFIDALP